METYYRKKYKLFVKNTSPIKLIKLQYQLLDNFYKTIFFIFIFTYIFSAIFVIYFNNYEINKYSYTVLILSFLLGSFLKKEIKNNFIIKYSVDTFNLSFYHIKDIFFNSEEQKQYSKKQKIQIISSLIEINENNIQKETNTILHNPLVILFLTLISAIVVNMLTSNNYLNLDSSQLYKLIIFILFIMFLFILLKMNILSTKFFLFKTFLIHLKYDLDNPLQNQ